MNRSHASVEVRGTLHRENFIIVYISNTENLDLTHQTCTTVLQEMYAPYSDFCCAIQDTNHCPRTVTSP